SGEAAVAAIETELEDLREQLEGIRENAALQAKGSLTGEQQAKLAELEAAAELQQEVRMAVGAGLIAGPDGDFGPGGPGVLGKGGRGKGKGFRGGGPGRPGSAPNAE